MVTLLDASNGGRISERQNTYTILILANDNPHGIVQFNQSVYDVHEAAQDFTHFVYMQRR